jgi:hypothetical protein
MAKSSVSTESLRVWNSWLAAVYAVEAAIVVIFGTAKMVPVFISYLTTDSIQSKVTGHTVLASATHQLWDVRLSILVAAVLVAAAIAHVVLAMWYRPKYEAGLKDGVNKVRWIEFAISGGLMTVVLALLAGIYDLGSLALLFSLAAVAALCGLIMETHNPWRRVMQVKWVSFAVGGVAALLAWLVIGLYVLATNLYGSGSLSAYFYVLYALAFVALAGTAGLLLVRYKRNGRWADYYYCERSYMILGVVAKTLFAGLVLLGALR